MPRIFPAGQFILLLSLLLNTSRLPLPAAQVVESAAPDPAPVHHLDLVDIRGVQGEDPLHADAVIWRRGWSASSMALHFSSRANS